MRQAGKRTPKLQSGGWRDDDFEMEDDEASPASARAEMVSGDSRLFFTKVLRLHGLGVCDGSFVETTRIDADADVDSV